MAFEKDMSDMNQWFTEDNDQAYDVQYDNRDEDTYSNSDTDSDDESDNEDTDSSSDDDNDDKKEKSKATDDGELEKSIEKYLNTGLKMVDKFADIIRGKKASSEPSEESKKKKNAAKDYEDIPINVPTQEKPRKALPAKRTAASDHETAVLDDVRRALENVD